MENPVNCSNEARVHLLAAKLRAKLESLHVIEHAPAGGDKTLSEKEIMRKEEYPTQINSSHEIELDQLALQLHAKERENMELKSKCELYAKDVQNFQNSNASLENEIKQKSLEIEELRQKQEVLWNDSQIFETYLNSIRSDEVAVKVIIQKIQDAYQMTREELTKLSTQYKESLKIIKEYIEHFQAQDRKNESLRNQILDMQKNIETERSEREQLSMQKSLLEEKEIQYQEQINRLRSTTQIASVDERVQNKIAQIISQISNITSDWGGATTTLTDKISELNEQIRHRTHVITNEHSREVRNMQEMLQQRESVYNRSIGSQNVSAQDPKGTHQFSNDITTLNKQPQPKEITNKMKRSKDESMEAVKSDTIRTNPESSKKRVLVRDTDCPICNEKSSGIMKVCKKCDQQYHSTCLRKIKSNDRQRPSLSFQCPQCAGTS